MQPSRPVENLEPLNFGPDLEPIKEEVTPRESLDVNSVDERSAVPRSAATEVKSTRLTARPFCLLLSVHMLCHSNCLLQYLAIQGFHLFMYYVFIYMIS